jgi:predicted nucleic acid-binding protein
VRRVLIDTGPLVAILSAADLYHDICVAALHDLPGPLFSCWPVITEAAWLLRRSPALVMDLLQSVSTGFLELLPLSGLEADALAGLMTRYASLRPQLADAALIHLANRDGIDTIFTLDRRDFTVYRSAKNRPFRIVPDTK